MKTFKQFLTEETSSNDFVNLLNDFTDYACDYLGIDEPPNVNLTSTNKFSAENSTFACYSPSNKDITVSITHRHPMDVLRSFAHELVHYKQDIAGDLHAESGRTGSNHENEANSLAGVMLRDFGHKYPELFKLEYIDE